MTNWYSNVPAPTDKYNHVVPLDTKELVYRGEVRDVCTFTYNTRYRYWGAFFENGASINLDACTMLDSWERLEEDIQKVTENNVCGYFDKDDVPCGDCPAHRTQDNCLLVAMRDVMRRAKALAETDADD